MLRRPSSALFPYTTLFRSEVREAVIQTILHVARQFPIIRFDAVMTLTKRHYQRLWFPEPGTGGAIPTRAEHGTTRSEEHTSELQSLRHLVCRLLLEKKKQH